MKLIKISSIKLNPDNPRVIKDKQFKSLVRSIKRDPEFLEKRGIVHANGIILGGNQRFTAIKEAMKDDEFRQRLGLSKDEIPASWVQDASNWPEEKQRRFVIADNGSWGEWDMDILANLWTDEPLQDLGTGLPDDWLDQAIKEEKEKEEDLLDVKEEILDGFGKVFDLKADVAFDGVGIYDLPEIKTDMILDVDSLSTWAGPNATHTEPPYLYNYSTDSTIGLPWNKTIVSFYTGDHRFENLWDKTSEVVKRMLNKKIMGCISPNYSTYFKWPKALRIYNIFRARWVGRYLQEAGIKIIPDITGGWNDIDCICDGIPRKSVIAIQAHQKYTPESQAEKDKVINHILKELDPVKVIVYATEDRKEMFPIFKNYNTLFLTPRTILQREERQRKSKERR